MSLLKRLSAAATIAVGVMMAQPPAQAESRTALVIGNGNYSFGRLANPTNDAGDIADALRAAGFDVILKTDANQATMKDAIRSFGSQLKTKGGVGLLFYAGHGVQARGENYLLPIGERPSSEEGLKADGVTASEAVDVMSAAKNSLNIVILDACRDNPLAANLTRRLGTRSGAVSRGLAQVDTSVGTLIAFSTQPGNVALDGEGRNSPFTTALLKSIEVPGLSLGEVMIDVRNDVLRSTDRKQVPWDNSSLTGQFYFKPLPASAATNNPGNEGVEIAFWNSIKDSKNPQLFDAYLRRYPNGSFSDIAKINADQFKVAVARPLAPEPEQKVSLSDPGLLREVRDRLYELNFDPGSPDAPGLKVAIAEFEEQSGLPRTGEASRGLLGRLRDIGGLKPWGAIVYDKGEGKWGMAWDGPTRRTAVAGAREQCKDAKCPYEISFFGTSCGAFALSPAGNFSIVSRDDIQKAKQAALDDCAKRGKACKIIGASCADGTGRATN